MNPQGKQYTGDIQMGIPVQPISAVQSYPNLEQNSIAPMSIDYAQQPVGQPMTIIDANGRHQQVMIVPTQNVVAPERLVTCCGCIPMKTGLWILVVFECLAIIGGIGNTLAGVWLITKSKQIDAGIWYLISGLGIFILAIAFVQKVFKYLCNANKIQNDKSKNRKGVASAMNILLILTIWGLINNWVTALAFPNAMAAVNGRGRGGRGEEGYPYFSDDDDDEKYFGLSDDEVEDESNESEEDEDDQYGHRRRLDHPKEDESDDEDENDQQQSKSRKRNNKKLEKYRKTQQKSKAIREGIVQTVLSISFVIWWRHSVKDWVKSKEETE